MGDRADLGGAEFGLLRARLRRHHSFLPECDGLRAPRSNHYHPDAPAFAVLRPDSSPRGRGRRSAMTPSSRLGQVSWALYDWANSAFSAVIITFVFATYFTQAIAVDTETGTAQWGWALGSSGIAIALLSPVLGAVADASGRRKPWLLAFTCIAVIGCFLLWHA